MSSYGLQQGRNGCSGRPMASPRAFYVREQFEDLFRAFFKDVSSVICGQESDAIPLPDSLRKWVVSLTPESYLRKAQARRGAFIFLKATDPE